MNLELSGVAERLVREFAGLPVCEVIDAVCACAEACDAAGPFFIEQAVRAELAAREHHRDPTTRLIPQQLRGVAPASVRDEPTTPAVS